MRNKKACLFIFSLSDVMIGRCRRLSDGISDMILKIIKLLCPPKAISTLRQRRLIINYYDSQALLFLDVYNNSGHQSVHQSLGNSIQ